MPPFVVAVRWTTSMPVFALCWLLGLTLGSTALGAFGADPPYRNMAGIVCATICGSLAAILTAPPQQRRVATHLFVFANVALALYGAAFHGWRGDLALREQLAVLGAIGGGGVVYAAIGSAYPAQQGADSHAAETARLVVRWVVAVLLSVLTYFVAFLLAAKGMHWLADGFAGHITGMTFTTTAAVLVGFLVAPPRHRAFAFWTFIAAANLFVVGCALYDATRGHVKLTDYADAIGSLIASLSMEHYTHTLRRSPLADPAGSAALQT
jgi:hypothetical protein